MLLAGDEIANSQQGNNNAYCQDNSIGWINWTDADDNLLEFVTSLSEFRRSHKSLRQTRFLHGARRPQDGLPDVEWTDFKGAALQWKYPGLSNLCLTLRCSAEAAAHTNDSDTVFVVFNRDEQNAEVTLPKTLDGQHWVRCVDTAEERMFPACEINSATILVLGESVVALALGDGGLAK